jgi:hypothetical protein
MDYYKEGFEGYLNGLKDSEIMRRLGIDPLRINRHEAERKAIISGWCDAIQLDRATTPAANKRE